MDLSAAALQKAYLTLVPATSPGTGGGTAIAAAGAVAGAVAGSAGSSAAGAAMGSSQITFRYNPKDLKWGKSATWGRQDVRGNSVLEFTGEGPRTLDFEFVLDATDSGTLRRDTETLFACVTPTAESVAANKPSPPFVIFGWGTSSPFKAVVKSVNLEYVRFQPDGTPVLGKGRVSLEEVRDIIARQNPSSGGLGGRRVHTLLAGDTLASIAYREYRDATRWRALAEANAIDDPLRLVPGTRLLVPTPEQAAARA